MGTNTLTSVTSGSVIQDADINQFITALQAAIVPRNSSGVVAANSGTLGTVTYPFSTAYSQKFISVSAGVSPTSTNFVGVPQLHLQSSTYSAGQLITNNDDLGNYPLFVLAKSKGSSESQTIIASGDVVGEYIFSAYDGTNYKPIASILSAVDGGVGTNDTPGRLSLYTTPDGSSSLVERVRINNAGNVSIGHSSPESRLDVLGSGSSNTQETTGSSGRIVGPSTSSIERKGTLNLESNTAQGADVGASVTFAGRTGASDSSIPFAKISGRKLNSSAGNATGYLGVSVAQSNGDLTELVRVLNSGDIIPVVDDSADLGGSSNRWDDIYATNATIQTSDENLKTDIQTLSLGTQFLESLNPVTFKWKDSEGVSSKISTQKYKRVQKEVERVVVELEDGKYVRKTIAETITVNEPMFEIYPLYDETGARIYDKNGTPLTHEVPVMEETEVEVGVKPEGTRHHVGLIAQEFKHAIINSNIDPNTFAPFIENQESGLQGIRYAELIPILIKAIQELSERVSRLE